MLEAADGGTALALIKAKSPDCCILDINLPVKSGLEVLKAMRQGEEGASVPVLLCTAIKDDRVKKSAEKLGISGYILKPFQMHELLGEVASCVA